MPTESLEEFVDTHRLGAFQLKIIFLCLLVLVVDGFDNQASAFVAPALSEAWHVPRTAFGPVFSAGAFGTLIGSLSMGPIGDWLGRKLLIIGSLVLVMILMAATAWASSVQELLILRFLCGLPLGALIPSAVVMATEWSPRRHRATIVTIMGFGFALGAAVGGFLASFLIPRYGWPAVFYVGAAGACLLGVALTVQMPESLRFLALRPTPAQRARAAAILRRFDAGAILPDPFAPPPARPAAGNLVVQLFRDRRTGLTLLLWLVFFMNLMVMNGLNYWLPSLLNAAGLPMAQALRVSALYQTGGIAGVILMGLLAGRWNVWRVLILGYFCSCIAVAALGVTEYLGGPLPIVVAAAGFCIIGVQASLQAQAAALYPTAIRSTGSSWAQGIGRLGSSAGPLAAGILVGWQWPPLPFFGCIAAVSACGWLFAMLLARRAIRHAPSVISLAIHPGAAGTA
jgi:MFS transporter, AAHS family, 4-hydroxybenzoate transporter